MLEHNKENLVNNLGTNLCLDLENFIFMDGGSGTGKSLLLQNLATQFSTRSCLKEVTLYAGEWGFEIPSMDMEPNRLRELAGTWVQMDKLRANKLSHKFELTEDDLSKLSYLDTSPIMTIAFELAKESMGYPAFVNEILSSYMASITEGLGELFSPSHWIFLHADPSIIKKRLTERAESDGCHTVHPFMLREDVTKYMQDFILSFAMTYLNTPQRTIIDTSDLTPKQVKEIALSIKASKDLITSAFPSFIEDLIRTRNFGYDGGLNDQSLFPT